jgi:hypothetical protein
MVFKLGGGLLLVSRTESDESIPILFLDSSDFVFEFLRILLDHLIHFFSNRPDFFDNFVFHTQPPIISSGDAISGQTIPSSEQIDLNIHLTLEFAICLKFQLTI